MRRSGMFPTPWHAELIGQTRRMSPLHNRNHQWTGTRRDEIEMRLRSKPDQMHPVHQWQHIRGGQVGQQPVPGGWIYPTIGGRGLQVASTGTPQTPPRVLLSLSFPVCFLDHHLSSMCFATPGWYGCVWLLPLSVCISRLTGATLGRVVLMG